MELDDEQCKSMQRAGIPARYHRQRLSDFKGTNMSELFDRWAMDDDEFNESILIGQGWTVIAPNKGFDVMAMVARTYFLRKHPVVLLSLSQLADQLREHGWAGFDDFRCLCITGFARRVGIKGDSSNMLDAREAIRVEDFLQSFIGGNNAVVVQVDTEAAMLNQWSGYLVSSLQQNNVTVQYNG